MRCAQRNGKRGKIELLLQTRERYRRWVAASWVSCHLSNPALLPRPSGAAHVLPSYKKWNSSDERQWYFLIGTGNNTQMNTIPGTVTWHPWSLNSSPFQRERAKIMSSQLLEQVWVNLCSFLQLVYICTEFLLWWCSPWCVLYLLFIKVPFVFEMLAFPNIRSHIFMPC